MNFPHTLHSSSPRTFTSFVVALVAVLLLQVTPFGLAAVGADGEPQPTPIPADVQAQLDELFAPSLDQSTVAINNAASFAAGFDGTGQTIVIIDTGVDTSHPFVQGKVILEACFTSNACPNGTSRQFGAGSAPPCIWGTGCGHGTHVAGIIAGTNNQISGVAPGSRIISIQVFSREEDVFECEGKVPCARAHTDDVLAALEYVYTLRSEFQIAAVNLSLSSDDARTGCDQSIMKAPIDRLRGAGIATIVSSGNGGYKNGLGLPACITSSISVGATLDGNNDTVWDLSNSSVELDFLAPGVKINSSIPGGKFASATGTSAAAPHVAGAWALTAQRLGTRDVATIANHLRRNGNLVTDSNGISTPRIFLGLPFSDVPISEFYYAAVTYLLDSGITTGTSATTFSPDAGVTRGQTAAFLHRMSGSPGGNPKAGYGDVSVDVFYSEPVDWMKARGLTNVPSGGLFAPNRTVTRAEMAAFLHRLAGSPKATTNEPFSDVSSDVFYAGAVQWLRESGITVGIGANTFAPDAAVTRGQMATFLHRLHNFTGVG